MGRISFTTTLQRRGPAAAVVLDDDQVAAVGGGAQRFPVKLTVNGHSWRGSVARMGGESLLGLSEDVRSAAGVEAGAEVAVEIELDRAERAVEVPESLARVLASDAGARAGFERLSYTHRKEYARWVGEAKKAETRERRLVRARELLRAGKPLR